MNLQNHQVQCLAWHGNSVIASSPPCPVSTSPFLGKKPEKKLHEHAGAWPVFGGSSYQVCRGENEEEKEVQLRARSGRDLLIPEEWKKIPREICAAS